MLFFERADWEEQALIVHPQFRAKSKKYVSHDPEEFCLLCLTAGVKIVGEVSCTRDKPEPKYYIGKGKAEEILQQLNTSDQMVVLINDDLSPSQLRNLEGLWRCRVVDRTGVILDIFAQRAQTYEGKLQVELAQLRHLSTRLVRGWTHLERQKGGIGLRGPGETQLEADRRMVRQQIETVKKRLQGVKKQRAQSRRSRDKSGVPQISLVGYTNAGKSSLFNAMTNAEILAKDQLFSTLDPSVRKVKLKAMDIFISDTVGFVSHLPHTLVDAFRATLEEAASADLLVVVLDAADVKAQQLEKLTAVQQVLAEIGAEDIPQLVVSNKIDKTDLLPRLEYDDQKVPARVWLSAKTGVGMDLFYAAIQALLVPNPIEKILKLKPNEASLRAKLYDKGFVVSEMCDLNGIVFLKVKGDEVIIDMILNKYRQRGHL